jgi:predicted nucleotidyltransferase
MVRINESALRDLCERNDVAVLRLFGSAARGEETHESDIDLLVRFARPKGLLELVRLERDLGEILARRVDLVTERALSPYLKDRILADARVVYERAG